MEIRDWSIARELDIEAAIYVQTELRKLDSEREQRDREFWIAAFGGSSDSEDGVGIVGEVGVARFGQG